MPSTSSTRPTTARAHAAPSGHSGIGHVNPRQLRRLASHLGMSEADTMGYALARLDVALFGPSSPGANGGTKTAATVDRRR